MKPANETSVLIVYTGGTIGMIENPATGALENFSTEQLREHLPELRMFDFHIDVHAFDPPIDSSDMEPKHWTQLATHIYEAYDRYDGFVVLHGTDTMAYTASALSFMLECLAKPVIFTGSQLPIGRLRTDGKENLLTAIEIAAAKDEQGRSLVPEVCIYFDGQLMRGNRTTKLSSEGFNAFNSFNFPPLATAGVDIHYMRNLILSPETGKQLILHPDVDNHIVELALFPGINRAYVEAALNVKGLRALVLKTYGSGNAPQKPWLVDLLRQLNDRGCIIVNLTQCSMGGVEMRRYETGLQLLEAGVEGGYDSTIECTITKLMVLLGCGYSREKILRLMNTNLAGEISRAINGELRV